MNVKHAKVMTTNSFSARSTSTAVYKNYRPTAVNEATFTAEYSQNITQRAVA